MIDDRTVAHVARLSRLELSPEERDKFRDQLGEILAYVRRLDALDLAGVPPTAHVRPMANVLRDDEVRASLTQAEALANAPAVEQGYFVVPPVITEEAPE
jgi:aspartyl-tRNA(Asn)/glutamyl-tRNA(Gln) amidotransferase subunit C